MSAFPVLKSGAVAQYPAERTVAKLTWVGRFVDGSEQRFRSAATPLHRWTIKLSLLTEAEVVAIREFVNNLGGRFESFTFTDPWDSTVYSSCSLASDTIAIEWLGENDARTTLTIQENRS